MRSACRLWSKRSPKRPHLAVERLLAGVGEGRMADVVSQRQRLGEIFVQVEHRGRGAGNLRHLDGVGQAVAEMVGKPGREHLGFGFQAAEGAGMDNAVAVALEAVAVRVVGFRVEPAPALRQGKPQPA